MSLSQTNETHCAQYHCVLLLLDKRTLCASNTLCLSNHPYKNKRGFVPSDQLELAVRIRTAQLLSDCNLQLFVADADATVQISENGKEEGRKEELVMTGTAPLEYT